MAGQTLSECIRRWYAQIREAPTQSDMEHFADCIAELEQAVTAKRKRKKVSEEGVIDEVLEGV